LELAAGKLPIKTKFIARRDVEADVKVVK
jgi:hypothetical protein